ncbi:MAG: hypothetical protein ACRBN8_22285 [Nannocystales bacterium]
MAFLLAASVTMALAVPPPSPPTSEGPRRKTAEPQLGQDSARGFVVAGAVLTGLSTWSSGMIASRYLDSRNATQQARGRVLPIPFAGPIVAAAMGTRTQQPIAALGVIQGAGLSFLTIGAVSLARHRRLGHRRGPLIFNKATGVLALTQGVMWLSVSWGMTFGFSRTRAKSGDAFARRLQVPIIGGLWAAPIAPSYTRGYLGLTSSAIQIASAAGVVFGAVMLRKHHKNRLSVMPMPTPEGPRLVASMRF